MALFCGDLISPPQLLIREIVLLTGDNGVGKSSYVNFLNCHFAKMYPDLKWGLVSQSRLSPLGERCAQNLIEVLKTVIFDFKFVDFFSLGPLLNRPIHLLSGGENQKLKLSLGFSLGQDFLILDEPSNNLDQTGIDCLRSLIQGRKQRGQGVLIVSHQPQLLSGLKPIHWHMQTKQNSISEDNLDELEIVEVFID